MDLTTVGNMENGETTHDGNWSKSIPSTSLVPEVLHPLDSFDPSQTAHPSQQYAEGVYVETAHTSQQHAQGVYVETAHTSQQHVHGMYVETAHPSQQRAQGVYVEMAHPSQQHAQGVYVETAHTSQQHAQGVYVETAHTSQQHAQGVYVETAHTSQQHVQGVYVETAHPSQQHAQGVYVETAHPSQQHAQGVYVETAHPSQQLAQRHDKRIKQQAQTGVKTGNRKNLKKCKKYNDILQRVLEDCRKPNKKLSVEGLREMNTNYATVLYYKKSEIDGRQKLRGLWEKARETWPKGVFFGDPNNKSTKDGKKPKKKDLIAMLKEMRRQCDGVPKTQIDEIEGLPRTLIDGIGVFIPANEGQEAEQSVSSPTNVTPAMQTSSPLFSKVPSLKIDTSEKSSFPVCDVQTAEEGMVGLACPSTSTSLTPGMTALSVQSEGPGYNIDLNNVDRGEDGTSGLACLSISQKTALTTPFQPQKVPSLKIVASEKSSFPVCDVQTDEEGMRGGACRSTSLTPGITALSMLSEGPEFHIDSNDEGRGEEGMSGLAHPSTNQKTAMTTRFQQLNEPRSLPEISLEDIEMICGPMPEDNMSNTDCLNTLSAVDVNWLDTMDNLIEQKFQVDKDQSDTVG